MRLLCENSVDAMITNDPKLARKSRMNMKTGNWCRNLYGNWKKW